jgi:Ni/Fe-hydrogenase subunit HybB-like protein
MSAHAHPAAVGGKMLGGPMKALLAIFGVSAIVMAYRFVTGVGFVSNMTDGFTWGIWEPVNVVVFTGIGAGAYATGLLCYAFGQGRYHGLIRPAVLVGAISYTLGASSIVIALGRYWNSYWLPWVPYWNLSSALLEVAVCVMMYVSVLWIEVLPSVFDGLAESPSPKWSSVGKTWGPRLAKAMPFLIAAAIVLPTMHQSSLGGLMLIAGPKIHPFWHTALLPALFLVSCLSMGFGAVVVVVNILKVAWNAEADQKLFVGLSKANAVLLVIYSVVRVADLAAHGKFTLLGANFPTFLFLVEMACFVVPAVMFLMPSVQANRGKLFGAAALAVFAGAAYRCDAYMSMYRPAGWTDGVPNKAGWEYWPSLGETSVTVGMAAVGVAIFIFIARKFPVVVLAGRAHSNLASGQVKAVANR